MATAKETVNNLEEFLFCFGLALVLAVASPIIADFVPTTKHVSERLGVETVGEHVNFGLPSDANYFDRVTVALPYLMYWLVYPPYYDTIGEINYLDSLTIEEMKEQCEVQENDGE